MGKNWKQNIDTKKEFANKETLAEPKQFVETAPVAEIVPVTETAPVAEIVPATLVPIKYRRDMSKMNVTKAFRILAPKGWKSRDELIVEITKFLLANGTTLNFHGNAVNEYSVRRMVDMLCNQITNQIHGWKGTWTIVETPTEFKAFPKQPTMFGYNKIYS